MKTSKKDKFQAYFDEVEKISVGAPSSKDLLSKFENGDFSCVDPEFFQSGHDILEKFLKDFGEPERPSRKDSSRSLS